MHPHTPRGQSLAFSHLPAGDGATPAVHITTLLKIRSPATVTPSASMLATPTPNRTSTPSRPSLFIAASESPSVNVPRIRLPRSITITRADVGSILRNSLRSVVRTKTNKSRCFDGPSSASAAQTPGGSCCGWRRHRQDSSVRGEWRKFVVAEVVGCYAGGQNQLNSPRITVVLDCLLRTPRIGEPIWPGVRTEVAT